MLWILDPLVPWCQTTLELSHWQFFPFSRFFLEALLFGNWNSSIGSLHLFSLLSPSLYIFVILSGRFPLYAKPSVSLSFFFYTSFQMLLYTPFILYMLIYTPFILLFEITSWPCLMNAVSMDIFWYFLLPTLCLFFSPYPLPPHLTPWLLVCFRSVSWMSDDSGWPLTLRVGTERPNGYSQYMGGACQL